ncbi:MAG: transporter substrate-binding domain-containing protein [Clostridia bacterium]|nr:transporter substrate-binding domain-containing protein [Clostridia bacterium]
MKKLLALFMAALLVFSFAACGEKADNKLVCGVTIFENMNEQNEDGTWTGFETEFAQEVGKLIGMEVEFQVIDWGQKYNELESGAIDCVWNGFTANSTDEVNGVQVKRSDLVDFSYGYMLNQQCIVTKAENVDKIKTAEDLKGKTACVEGGSAGASYAATVTDADKISTTEAQIKAFTEVKAGAVDFTVVDIILAKNICGKGDYADLAIVESIELDSEIYAVGFKKGSELTAKVNEAIKTLEANGKLMELAKKYGFENVLQVTETIE